MGHGVAYPYGPYNISNKGGKHWTNQLMVQHIYKQTKHEIGLGFFTIPVAMACAGAAFFVVKKMFQDPNIIMPVPRATGNRYVTNFDYNVLNYTFPGNVTPEMKEAFKNRRKYFKDPNEIPNM